MGKIGFVRLGRRLAWPAGAALAFAASAQQYTAVELGTLGGAGASAYGVNDIGMVVGASLTESSELHAFVWEDGVMTDLGTLAGGDASEAFSVNNSGVIVGRSRNANGVDRPVRWTRQGSTWTIEDLGTFGGAFGWATRVNEKGQITGYASLSTGPYHAFLWTSGNMKDLGTLSYTGNLAYSQALGLNEAGQTVGFAYKVLGGPEHGFFHDGDKQLDITPLEPLALAQGHNVNSSGLIAGYIAAPSTGSAFRAAVYDPTTKTWKLIDPLPGTGEGFAYDINESGAVVGTSFTLGFPNVFIAFLYASEKVYDLNEITTGEPGPISEAFDISNTGLIAALGESGGNSAALLLKPVNTCPGDLDGDKQVGQSDLGLLLSAYGACPGEPGYNAAAGLLGGNACVGQEDLGVLLGAYGMICP